MVSHRVEFDGFRKRNGTVVPFRREKIELAVQKAAEAVAAQTGAAPADPGVAVRVTDRVVHYLADPQSEFCVLPEDDGRRLPKIEDVQDVVEIVLAEEGLAEIVSCYKRYRKQREMARRRIRVRQARNGTGVDATDTSLLLVESTTGNVALPWDRGRIVTQLLEKTQLTVEQANAVAKRVENAVVASGVHTISTALIREFVNNELIAGGFRDQLRDLSVYGVARDYVEQLMDTKHEENSNVVNNNPEAVNLSIAELVLKQWALDTIFSPDVKRAHDTGAVHLHDLGYPHRVYCSSHSVEYVKKYGLCNLVNLNTESRPARSAEVLTGHINTFLASMQANYAGALGLGYINVFFAPFLRGMSRKQIKQTAQMLVFNGSQNAFSRGGQTLFLDFNVHSGVPSYLRTVPAMGPGGHYQLARADGQIVELEDEVRTESLVGGYQLQELYCREADGSRRLVRREVPASPKPKGTAASDYMLDPAVEQDLAAHHEHIVTYGEYEAEARDFASALLEVWGEGDRNGRLFEFPKCDFHVNEDTFREPEQYRIFMEACQLASKNGSTYFIFDRDEVTLSACCRLRTTITEHRMLRHPESMRFCGFQNVTINIPQAAYRASRRGHRDFGGLCEEIDQTMEIAVKAHLQKRKKATDLMAAPGRPLYQIGRQAMDGVPYVDLDKCTYIIGLIGVNDAVKFLTGEELHESRAAFRLGLRIVAHMYLKVKEFSEKYSMKFSLEESPAESAARRLAKTDLVYFKAEAQGIVKGDNEDVVYYTNSVHLAADAPVSLVERIRQQSKFHGLIESGAITHAFVGEEKPSARAIARLMEDVFRRTQSAQVCISPEFTYCDECFHIARGLLKECPQCHSTKVVGESRIVGYFSKIHNWNKSKRLGELKARQRGRYSITQSSPEVLVPDQGPEAEAPASTPELVGAPA